MRNLIPTPTRAPPEEKCYITYYATAASPSIRIKMGWRFPGALPAARGRRPRARPPACFTVLHHFRTKVSVDAPFSKRDDVAVGVAKKLDARACGAACDAATTASTMCKEGRKKERAWPRLRRTPRYAVCFLHRRRCRRRNCCCCCCGASPKVKAARLTGEGRGPLRRRRRPCSTPPAPLLLRHATRGALGKGEGGGEREGEGEGEGTMKLPNQTMPDKLARKLNFPRN